MKNPQLVTKWASMTKYTLSKHKTRKTIQKKTKIKYQVFFNKL